MRKAAFFDRDGVINTDYGYVGQISRFELIPGVIDALSYLRQQGFLLILVTNQSGIARGLYTEADFFKVSSFMQYQLALHNSQFDAIYFCPHHPAAALLRYRIDCNCRKPKPGMFLKAKQDLGINLKNSLMFGDQSSDLVAAQSAGIERLFFIGHNCLDQEKKVCVDALCAESLHQAVMNFIQ